MNFQSFLTQGFQILPKKDVTFPSDKVVASLSATGTVSVLFNTTTHRDGKSLGGFEPKNEAQITVETVFLVAPKTMIGKLVTIDEADWRCESVKVGEVFTTFTLIDEEEA